MALRQEETDIPTTFQSAEEMLGWLIAQFEETARRNGAVVLVPNDMNAIVSVYKKSHMDFCQN